MKRKTGPGHTGRLDGAAVVDSEKAGGGVVAKAGDFSVVKKVERSKTLFQI